LQSVSFAGNPIVSDIHELAFAQSGLASIRLPGSLKRIHGSAFAESPLKPTVTTESGFAVVGFFFTQKIERGIALIRYFGTASQVVIGKQITVLGRGCFAKCSWVDSVIMDGTNVVAIEEGAFEGTALMEIKLPRSVVEIDPHAFEYTCAVDYADGEKIEEFEAWKTARLADPEAKYFRKGP
jgi:hypothetical protein